MNQAWWASQLASRRTKSPSTSSSSKRRNGSEAKRKATDCANLERNAGCCNYPLDAPVEGQEVIVLEGIFLPLLSGDCSRSAKSHSKSGDGSPLLECLFANFMLGMVRPFAHPPQAGTASKWTVRHSSSGGWVGLERF